MVTDISWWALDGCCYFLVGSGWLLLFPGGQLQITCQLLSLLDVHQRPRQCGPTENTVSIDTASHLYVTFPPRCRCRHSAGRGA